MYPETIILAMIFFLCSRTVLTRRLFVKLKPKQLLKKTKVKRYSAWKLSFFMIIQVKNIDLIIHNIWVYKRLLCIIF